MAYFNIVYTYAATPAAARDAKRYMKAYAKAAERAPHSYFDQHVIRMDDGRYWVADEGDYETLMQDLVDRIVHTVPAGKSDEW